jgi:hypothetical protein
MALGFHTAPPGRGSLGRTLPQGFTLGYFRPLPPGGTVLDASLLPHLDLLSHERPDESGSNAHNALGCRYALGGQFVLRAYP